MSVRRHAGTEQRPDDGKIIAGGGEPQCAVPGVAGRGRIGTVGEKQRQTLNRVRVGGNLQQRIALGQAQIGIARRTEQLLHARRVVARHRES